MLFSPCRALWMVLVVSTATGCSLQAPGDDPATGSTAAGSTAAGSPALAAPWSPPTDAELAAHLDEQLDTSHALRPHDVEALHSAGPITIAHLRAVALDAAAPLHRRTRATGLLGALVDEHDPLWAALIDEARPRGLRVQAAWSLGLAACHDEAKRCVEAVGRWLADGDARVREVGVDLAHRRLANLERAGHEAAVALLTKRQQVEPDPAVRARITKRLAALDESGSDTDAAVAPGPRSPSPRAPSPRAPDPRAPGALR